MARIANDQYFSTDITIEEQVKITYDLLKDNNIKVNRIVDPCAGIPKIKNHIENYFNGIPAMYFDIEPKADFIQRKDVRTLKKDKVLEKVDGTLFISNPPYNIMGSFWSNIKPYADYISMIIYASNYNYTPVALRAEFELLKSVNFGDRKYSGKNVTTCLNIYKRKSIKTKAELYPKEVDNYISTRTMIRYKSDTTRQKRNGYDLDLEKHVASTTDSKAKININDYAKLKFIKRTNIEKYKKWKDYREDLDTNHYDYYIISHGNVGRILYSKEELTHHEYIGIEFKNKLIKDYFNSHSYKEYIKSVKNPTGTKALGNVSLRSTDLKESMCDWIATNSTIIDNTYETNATVEIPEFENSLTANSRETTFNKNITTSIAIDTIWSDLTRNEGVIKLCQTISDIQINIPQKDSYYAYKPCLNLNENIEFNNLIADFRNLKILACDTKGNCELYNDSHIMSELFIISPHQILYYNDYDTT